MVVENYTTKSTVQPWPGDTAVIEVCDTHFHVFGAPGQYPMVATRSYDPPAASLSDYRRIFDPLGVRRMVLIQPSCYGTDNRCMLEARATLNGAGRAIVAISPETTDKELNAMHRAGARGIRHNLAPAAGSTVPKERLLEVAARLRQLNWVLQTFVPPGRLPEVADDLLATGLDVVIDHFGTLDPALGLDQPTLITLGRLLESGRCWVKLSAPFRISKYKPPYLEMSPYVKALMEMRGDRMVWGSDWPYIHHIDKVGQAYDPLQLLKHSITDQAQLKAVLADNPKKLFDFRD